MKPLRVEHVNRGQPFEIEVDGKAVQAYHGETVASVLMAAVWPARFSVPWIPAAALPVAMG